MKYYQLIIVFILVLIYLVLFFNVNNSSNRIKSLYYYSSANETANKAFIPPLNSSSSNDSIRLNNPIEACKSGRAKILAYIMIRVESFEKRRQIRRTWTNTTLFPHMAAVFVMGKSTDETLNKRVGLESKQYSDVIQGSYIDAYRNLTHKSLSAWEWILKNCSSAKYIVKIDDDFALHSIHLMEYFNLNREYKRTFLCDVYYGGMPHKDKNSKWYVTDEEYEKTYNLTGYPTFCLGPAYIMTADLIEQLYEQSFRVKMFWLEDIYTSLLASKISNVTFIQFNSKYASKSDVANRQDYILVRDTQTEDDLNYVMKFLIN